MDLTNALREQEQAWEARPLLRRLYGDWYRTISESLASVAGPTIELGCGISRFKEIRPDIVTTDVEPTPWANAVVDAEALPYEHASVANFVLIDVFHHLPAPTRFLDEAVRTLRPGGRVVILDPYCSPLSTVAYRTFHHERTDLSAPPFEEDAAVAAAPMDSNQARTTLIFFRNADEYSRRWPNLPITERRQLALLLYPLSGGFSRTPLVPDSLYRPFHVAERLLSPLAPLLAFRCLIVLERR
jgi:SAM-dependent methyltransferase